MTRQYIRAFLIDTANCPRGSVNVNVFIGLIKLFGLRSLNKLIFIGNKYCTGVGDIFPLYFLRPTSNTCLVNAMVYLLNVNSLKSVYHIYYHGVQTENKRDVK